MERTIGYVRRSFFVPLISRYRQLGQILDLETLNVEFARWLALTANTRIHGTTGEVPWIGLKLERDTLQPIPPSRLAVAYEQSTDDDTPVQSLGGFVMLHAIGLVALPAAILAGKFAHELARRRSKVTSQAVELLKDGKLDEDKQRKLEKRGHREGFSDDEIEEVKKSAMASIEGLQVCPKCGHILSTR